MKISTKNIVFVLLLSLALVSCRDEQKTEEEKSEVEEESKNDNGNKLQ